MLRVHPPAKPKGQAINPQTASPTKLRTSKEELRLDILTNTYFNVY